MKPRWKPAFRQAVRASGGKLSTLARAILLSAALLSLMLTGCSTCKTLQNGHAWGEDVIVPFHTDRLAQAFKKAAEDPHTWVPLIGAAAVLIDNGDHRISRWAADDTPLFGSGENARDASNYLLGALYAGTFATLVATPSGDKTCPWLVSKGKGLVVEGVAVGATIGVTDVMKANIDRTRPDKDDDRSFPSGHTSQAFSLAALSNRNLDVIDMPDGTRKALKLANTAVASGVAWARVEGDKHYPTDVLVGAALGNFLTVLVHDGLMNLPEDSETDVAVFVTGDGGGVQITHDF